MEKKLYHILNKFEGGYNKLNILTDITAILDRYSMIKTQ